MLTLFCAGYKLDFKKNSVLDGYVKNSFAKLGDRGDGYPQWKSKAGNIYCVSTLHASGVQSACRADNSKDEKNHWDVVYV